MAIAKSSHNSLWYHLRIVHSIVCVVQIPPPLLLLLKLQWRSRAYHGNCRTICTVQGNQTGSTNRPTFTNEVGLFVTAGEKLTRMQQIHRALLLVPPTSVEAERVFSASGFYLTKLRCRLSNSRFDMLVFLKFYFAW